MDGEMTILVVDDDPNTVQMIEDSIPWESYGIGEVLHAWQGVMGMDIVREHHPEIIISDIEMPQMDGMEFLEKVSIQYEEMPEFIFLTCHEDFSLYRKAIHFGVSEYLLKPFRQEELAAVLSKSVMRIKRRHNRGKSAEERRNRDASNQDLLIQSFLNNLFIRSVTGDREQLRYLVRTKKIPFEVDSPYYILCAGTTIDLTRKSGFSEPEFYFIFGNIASEVLSDRVNYPAVVSHTLRPYYILLMAIPAQFCSREELTKRCDRLIGTATQYLEVSLTCIVSKPCFVEDFGEISARIDQAYLQEGTLQPRTILLDEGEKRNRQNDFAPDCGEIATLLRDRKKTELILKVRENLAMMEEQQIMDPPHMLVYQNNLLQIFYGFLAENHLQSYQMYHNDISQQLFETAKYSVVGMIRFINYLYDSATQAVEQTRQSDTVTARAKNYIQEHYREKIGRGEIAASVFLAPTYLSKIFRESSGMTIREYINFCRVEEAKRLIVSTGYSMSDIAMEVGFDNIPYFFTVFKKRTGMTPDAWRQKVKS